MSLFEQQYKKEFIWLDFFLLKLDELLQMRENKLRKVIQNSMKEINDLKVKNIALYEKEFQASVDTVSSEYERMFLPESERSTNQANLKTLETQTEFTTQLWRHDIKWNGVFIQIV